MIRLQLRPPLRSKKGFTLVEIALVVGISAIFIAFATMGASSRIKAARTNALVVEINQIAQAAARAANLYETTFTMSDLVTKRLIQKSSNVFGLPYWLEFNLASLNQTVAIYTTAPKSAIIADFPSPFVVRQAVAPNNWQVSVEAVLPRAAKGRSDNIFFGF